MGVRFGLFSLSEKLQDMFEIAVKKYGMIVEKSLSEKTLFGKKNDTFFSFICQTSYCPNLRGNEQIPFDL